MSRRDDVAAQGRRQRAVEIMRGLWPLRHDYFGARLTLRSIIRRERAMRNG